jgi:predicted ATP-dependent serine protease
MLEEFILSPDALQDEISFLFPPLLMDGKITLLYSSAGVGKTTFVCRMILQLFDAGKLKRVVYIFPDSDTTNSSFAAVVERYYDGTPTSPFVPIIPRPPFLNKLFTLFRKGKLEELTQSDLVVVDSLEQLFELNGKDFHKLVGFFFSLLRELANNRTSVLLLHHTNKAGELAGRSVISTQSDAVYRLRREGKLKWFGECSKHRGGEHLNGRVDFYAEVREGALVVRNDVVDERYSEVVHLITQVLEGRRLRQSEIISGVQKLARKEDNEVGIHKIRKVLVKYDGILWKSERVRNSLEYELIGDGQVETSEVPEYVSEYAFPPP